MTIAASSCPSCGASITGDAKFCAECGDQLSGVVAAGFWIRFAAWLVDGVILTVVNIALSAIFGSTALLGLAVGIVYTIGFWTASGATPGKMVFGLTILTEDGEAVGIEKAVLRYIGYWVNVLTLGIGFLMIAFRKDKRGLHDLIAGTVVQKG